MNCEKYHPTYILIAVNAAVYVYTSIVGGNWLNTNLGAIPPIYQWNYEVFQGAYFQLFTSMFVHASIPHIVGNMLFLFIFGLRAEEMFSLPEYLGTYILGGLVGNVLSLAFGPNFLSVGASGAIFALFGACVIYDRHSVRQSLLGALVYAFFLLFLSGLGTGVNDLAHIGGLGFGLLIGYWIASTRKPHEQYSVRYKHPLYPF